MFHEKVVKENGDIIEARILRVSKSKAHPEGLRYSLVYIHQNKRVVGFDNFEGKSHHKQVGQQEFPYRFQTVEQLIRDFQEEVRKWKLKK